MEGTTQEHHHFIKVQKTFFFFFMQFVPVFMPGVSLESMFIIFPKNII